MRSHIQAHPLGISLEQAKFWLGKIPVFINKSHVTLLNVKDFFLH